MGSKSSSPRFAQGPRREASPFKPNPVPHPPAPDLPTPTPGSVFCSILSSNKKDQNSRPPGRFLSLSGSMLGILCVRKCSGPATPPASPFRERRCSEKEPWEYRGEVGWGGIPCPVDPGLNHGSSATVGCVWDSGRRRALLCPCHFASPELGGKGA